MMLIPLQSKAIIATKVSFLLLNSFLELGNNYDIFDERDRWQLYSKELQVKQEVL